MHLWLTPAQLSAIRASVEQENPNEACGLIGGIIDGELLRASTILPIPNRAVEPRLHFVMDEKSLVQSMMVLESQRLSLVGIYHSHPDGEPIPSREDIHRAYYPGTAYLIVGKTNIAAWDIRQGDVTPIPIHISEGRPQIVSSSRVIPYAALISAVIAFIFMLTLALALLPPPPDIIP